MHHPACCNHPTNNLLHLLDGARQQVINRVPQRCLGNGGGAEECERFIAAHCQLELLVGCHGNVRDIALVGQREGGLEASEHLVRAGAACLDAAVLGGAALNGDAGDLVQLLLRLPLLDALDGLQFTTWSIMNNRIGSIHQWQ
jgi:hypothetical protein